MTTEQKYVEYLVSTPINYTCSNLAEHLEGMSLDVVSDLTSSAITCETNFAALPSQLSNQLSETPITM